MTGATLPAEYTTLAAFAFFLVMFGAGARYAWSEFRKANEADRLWREKQDEKRDSATREINRDWINAMKEMDVRREKTDTAHTAAIERIGVILEAHDDQAKEIKQIVSEIHVNTRPGGAEERRTKPRNGL